MRFITYKPEGRLGNNLFQYMTCKLLQHLWGDLTYVDYPSWLSMSLDSIQLFTDEDFLRLPSLSATDYGREQSHVLCSGYFQRSGLFRLHRPLLRSTIPSSNDLFVHKISDYQPGHFRRYPVRDLFSETATVDPEDLVVSLRLDDFLQLPCATSDIVPPSYYAELLAQIPHRRAIVVCDVLRAPWERAYLRQLGLTEPAAVDLVRDFAVLRAAPRLLHSNSTLCWLASFFGDARQRWIPRTHFYGGQDLLAIGDEDVVTSVKPMAHAAVYSLPFDTYVHPLSYAIPDELVVASPPVKTEVWAGAAPSVHTFVEEEAYHAGYRAARFANTRKKGGWDALRHYEILANGCIPVIDLSGCPALTMTTFPAALVAAAAAELLPFNGEGTTKIYEEYVGKLLDHTRRHLTCSAIARSFLTTMRLSTESSVLILPCQPEPNYTREMLSIGLSRLLGDRCTFYPPIPFLHSDFPASRLASLHGRGFTYTRRLPPLSSSASLSEAEVLKGLESHRWDVVVYGKIGPDEFAMGSVPNVPYWSTVSRFYGKEEIAFLYGGDGCQDMTTANRYSDHLRNHMEHGHCFVRELRF